MIEVGLLLVIDNILDIMPLYFKLNGMVFTPLNSMYSTPYKVWFSHTHKVAIIGLYQGLLYIDIYKRNFVWTLKELKLRRSSKMVSI